MPNRKPYRIKTISEFHRFRGLPVSEHSLISVVDYASIKHSNENNSMSWVLDFYAISLKKSYHTKFKYGHQQCDFDEGSLFFMAPNQVFRVEVEKNHKQVNSGWLLIIHPEFIWGTTLAKTIKKYDFFDYAINEALFLSPKEEFTINNIVRNIQQEYQTSIDKFSKQIISTHIENLLSYSERFYNRQFITREKTNHKILERLEKLLTNYFNSDDLIIKGLPSVLYVSEELNVSQSYLGSLLRVLTGQNTQQHIHNKLIEKAKERLSITDLSISEVAYELGFEHSQSFSKLFKAKTNFSPSAYRKFLN